MPTPVHMHVCTMHSWTNTHRHHSKQIPTYLSLWKLHSFLFSRPALFKFLCIWKLWYRIKTKTSRRLHICVIHANSFSLPCSAPCGPAWTLASTQGVSPLQFPPDTSSHSDCASWPACPPSPHPTPRCTSSPHLSSIHFLPWLSGGGDWWAWLTFRRHPSRWRHHPGMNVHYWIIAIPNRGWSKS